MGERLRHFPRQAERLHRLHRRTRRPTGDRLFMIRLLCRQRPSSRRSDSRVYVLKDSSRTILQAKARIFWATLLFHAIFTVFFSAFFTLYSHCTFASSRAILSKMKCLYPVSTPLL